jgi:hypothetical protein
MITSTMDEKDVVAAPLRMRKSSARGKRQQRS